MYQDTLRSLRLDGWVPELSTLVQGTVGEIPTKASKILRRWALKARALRRY